MTNQLTKPLIRNRYANIPTQDGLDTCFIAYNKGVQDTLKMVSGWLTRKVYADGLLIPHSIIDELNQLAGEK